MERRPKLQIGHFLRRSVSVFRPAPKAVMAIAMPPH
jgi:hypothetical protein